MATMAKPLNSPLPSLPPKFAGPPPRSIPRRPVAAPITVAPTLAPTSSPALASPNPLSSPGGSISSLLSAYSNHTADSPRSSSATSPKGVLNSKGAYSVVLPSLDTQRSGTQSGAPTRDLPSLPSDQNVQKQEHNGNRISEGDRKELPPPPPLKDAQRSIPRPRTPTDLQTHITQPSTSTNTGSPLGNGSPQQGELWRRRSLKADKSLAVPDLKLVSSHGSTAASAQNTEQSGSDLFSQPFPLPPRSNPETLEPAATQRAPPRSGNGGLPGRDIRPAAGREGTSQGVASMGQEASRLKEKLGNGRRQGSREELKSKSQEAQAYQTTLSPATSAAVSPVSAARLPTPEYGTNDVKSPQPDTVVSPLSPPSSLELPGETKPVARKAIGATEAQLRHAKSSQSLAPGPINTGLAVRSQMGLPTSPRPDINQAPKQTQHAAPPARDQTGQKQYIPYSPPADRSNGLASTQFPTPPSKGDEDERTLPPAPRQEPSQTGLPQSTTQLNPWPQNPNRDPIPRTISETGSVETVKPPQPRDPTLLRQQPSHPSLTLTAPPPTTTGWDNNSNYTNNIHPTNTVLPPDLPLRDPDPSEPDTTDHPGAALFPRGWYTPLPADAVAEARPLAARHRACLTRHRYMTANRQRANPVACRTCGHADRNAECYICSACALNVCSGCVAVLRRVRGDVDAVVREVGRGRKVERGDGIGNGFAGDGGVVEVGM
ncbi:uncharacterized protein B0H64DRAFT_360215 [Chaetomium fimeti]|uniref:Uncharacterized protein n=1 Tax=Chaetomium fimeti TaxID=1854472 RepID=A0AAE0HGA3_9PEZI|nr:hypothetical protein B0H64DRAFT_360215 [Chaetomium fimeti]